MIVPQPVRVESLPGSFTLPDVLVVAHGDDGSAAEAALLVEHLQQRLGRSASAKLLEVRLAPAAASRDALSDGYFYVCL